jgi:plasmid stability protein
MAQLLACQLDDDVWEKLRLRALRHGRSTEAEVCEILRQAAQREAGAVTKPGLGSRISARFRGLGLETEIPELRTRGSDPT